MSKLDGKIALITGGTTDIGFSTAQLFLKEGARGIVSPGPVLTPLFDKLEMPKGALDNVTGNMAQSVAFKRLGKPDEIATLALFLASGDASFITGTEIFADGGRAEL